MYFIGLTFCLSFKVCMNVTLLVYRFVYQLMCV